MNKLQKLIRKSILEVLNEDDPNAIKGTINISSDDPDEQDKVQQAQQAKDSYSLYEDKELNEMARIATLIKAGKSIKFQASVDRYKGTWVGDLLDAVQESPDGITQPALAVAAGKSRQQDINPYIRKFLQDGTLVTGALEKPKQEKPESTGILGRPKTDDGVRKDTARNLMIKLKDDPNYDASEEIKVLGQAEVDKIKDLMASGGIKRGRKIGSSTKSTPNLSEMARTATKYVINDESLLTDNERENRWVSGILNYLNTNGSASTIEIAKNEFDRPQQSINMLIQALIKKGVLTPEGERDNRKTFAKKQNTYYNEEVPDEFADEIDPDDNSPLSAEDYFIGNKLQSRMKAPVEPLEQDDDAEPIIPQGVKKDGPIHKPNISDEDYKDLMKYLDYKERLKKIDNNLRKSNTKSTFKKSDSGDLSNSRSGDEGTRLTALKSSLEQKLADLKTNSPYIKSKLDREKDNSSMVAETKQRLMKLANING